MNDSKSGEQHKMPFALPIQREELIMREIVASTKPEDRRLLALLFGVPTNEPEISYLQSNLWAC